MENQVTQLLKAMVKPDYTACSYAFMQDGKIVCADAIGVIDKINNQPITTDCTFNVCSISKIYCTVCVMQLVDEGLIQLEDKVADILPEFTMKDERYKDITVRMCLDHSSGHAYCNIFVSFIFHCEFRKNICNFIFELNQSFIH